MHDIPSPQRFSLHKRDTMVNSPYSLSADDVRVFTEEDWRGMHLNAFRGDRLPISQSGTVTGTVISSNMYQDQTSQARTAPFYSNFTSPVAPRHFDWGPILRNEMPGASLDRHCTTESPGMASLEVQSAPDTTSPLTFNVWGQESHSFIDSNNGFSQEPSPQADFRSASTSRHSGGHLQCLWRGCNYSGVFSRKGVLMRHIETQHVNPRAFDCRECDKSFSRKDNMTEHRGRVHKKRY